MDKVERIRVIRILLCIDCIIVFVCFVVEILSLNEFVCVCNVQVVVGRVRQEFPILSELGVEATSSSSATVSCRARSRLNGCSRDSSDDNCLLHF